MCYATLRWSEVWPAVVSNTLDNLPGPVQKTDSQYQRFVLGVALSWEPAARGVLEL